MGFPGHNTSRLKPLALGLGTVLVLAVLFFAVALQRVDQSAREGVIAEAVCRQLLTNTTEGRQALISSVWWPPLAPLLRMPFAAVIEMESCPVASLLLSSLAGAGVLFLLNRMLQRWNLGWGRWLLVLSLALNPLFLEQCWNGSSTLVVTYLILLAAYGLVEWVARREMRMLVYVAIGSALLFLANFELSAWTLIVFLLVIADLALRPAAPGQRQAVLILAFLPLVYAAGLWVLMNWLIMGDGLYFLHSLAAPRVGRELVALAPLRFGTVTFLAGAVSLLMLLLAGLRQNRAGVYLATLAVAPLVLAVSFSAAGLLWDRVPVLFCLMPLAIITVGYTVGSPPGLRSGVRHVALALGPVMAIVAWLGLLLPGASGGAAAAPEDFAALTAERNHWLPLIERHVSEQSAYPKVFVCGYDGLAFLGEKADPVFVPALDFNFNKVKKDYEGHALYVLVHRPRNRSAMDSIHWKYKQIYTLGSRSTMYDGDWGDWRLFIIIQARR